MATEETENADGSKITAEQRLWRALRGRRLNDRKFRRKHTVGESGVVVDFICIEAGVAVNLTGPDRPKLSAEDGRVLKAAKIKLLKIPEEDVLGKFEKTLQLIWRETEQTVKRRPSF